MAGTPPENLLRLRGYLTREPCLTPRSPRVKGNEKHDVFKATRAIMRMYNASTSLSTRVGPPVGLRHCCTTLSKQGNLEYRQ